MPVSKLFQNKMAFNHILHKGTGIKECCGASIANVRLTLFLKECDYQLKVAQIHTQYFYVQF